MCPLGPSRKLNISVSRLVELSSSSNVDDRGPCMLMLMWWRLVCIDMLRSIKVFVLALFTNDSSMRMMSPPIVCHCVSPRSGAEGSGTAPPSGRTGSGAAPGNVSLAGVVVGRAAVAAACVCVVAEAEPAKLAKLA